jgi:hypothetical protein
VWRGAWYAPSLVISVVMFAVSKKDDIPVLQLSVVDTDLDTDTGVDETNEGSGNSDKVG